MRPGDHLFAIADDRAIGRAIIPAVIRRAMEMDGEVRIVYPAAKLHSIRETLGSARAELDVQEREGVVTFLRSEPLAALFRDPSMDGIEAFRGRINDEWQSAMRRGHSSLWIVTGFGAQLFEEGRGGQALFGEMYLHGQHQVLPISTLCTYPRVVGENALEGLRGTHHGQLPPNERP